MEICGDLSTASLRSKRHKGSELQIRQCLSTATRGVVATQQGEVDLHLQCFSMICLGPGSPRVPGPLQPPRESTPVDHPRTTSTDETPKKRSCGTKWRHVHQGLALSVRGVWGDFSMSTDIDRRMGATCPVLLSARCPLKIPSFTNSEHDLTSFRGAHNVHIHRPSPLSTSKAPL